MVLLGFGFALAACGSGDGAATLDVDSDCANGSEIQAAGETWRVRPPSDMPAEWQFLGDVDGEFLRTGDTSATFTVGDVNLDLTSAGDARTLECVAWANSS